MNWAIRNIRLPFSVRATPPFGWMTSLSWSKPAALLGTLRKEDVVECRADLLLEMLNETGLSDAEVDGPLDGIAGGSQGKEAVGGSLVPCLVFDFAGYPLCRSHPRTGGERNSLLAACPRVCHQTNFPGRDRLLRCCSVFVHTPIPVCGWRRKFADESLFIKKYQRPPRVVLLENHGIITLGKTVEAVLAAMLMAEKAAGIWLGAAALGGPFFISKASDAHCRTPDEAWRRKVLKIG